MASILDRYGIKEVADVTFYEIDKNTGEPSKPVLFLDTLKVSTVEQTASNADAKGGKGNATLVSWDFGKEITLNIEDALFSPKSMALMYGDSDGSVDTTTMTAVHKTAVARVKKVPAADAIPTILVQVYDSNSGKKEAELPIAKLSGSTWSVADPAQGVTFKSILKEDGTDAVATFADLTVGTKLFVEYEQSVASKLIEISADAFPGTYYVTGDTYARSDIDGKDEFFQFVLPKAKMLSEHTLTLEAEGDPSVFNMSLKVLRPEDGKMMKLIQYNLNAPATVIEG